MKTFKEEKIIDLINNHWKNIKNSIRFDGIKYSNKFSKDEHEQWVTHMISIVGFDDVEEMLLYSIAGTQT